MNEGGVLGRGGDVMVLDMGEPIKILDLAKRMIYLSGLTVKEGEQLDGDIDIIFTGLRPGEKLYEELLIGEHTLPTVHARILRAEEQLLSWRVLEPLLISLETAIKNENTDEIRNILMQAVPEFHPRCGNEDVLHMIMPATEPQYA